MAYGQKDLYGNRIVQSIEIVGALSSMAWLYQLKCHLHNDNLETARDHADCHSISSVNYCLDDLDILISDNVDLSWRRPWLFADHLVHTYFQAVHPAFPVIGKPVFLQQYQMFIRDRACGPESVGITS